jgi:threonine/homoserine/homoserine lactone efflux protein
MLDGINLPTILIAALLAVASPGPATLGVSSMSMQQGRGFGLAMAAGILTGSLIWSLSAAFGLGAVMLANVWLFEALRYCGAAYLLFLAVKSARSAMQPDEAVVRGARVPTLRRAYMRGLVLHLTNPKAILFIGSLYAIAVPPGRSVGTLLTVVAILWAQSIMVIAGYALIFSSPRVAGGYARLRRWFEGAFALAFGIAGLRVLFARS